MKIDYKLYQFTSKELVAMVCAHAKTQSKMYREAKKFAKKVGADTKAFATWSFGRNGSQIAGFHFAKTPDRKVWTQTTMKSGAWRPKVKSTLYKEFRELPKINVEDLAKKVEWKDIFWDGFFYGFNPFWDETYKFCGMSVPVFHPDDYKKEKTLEYKPVKGMKEITKAAYYRRMPK